MHNWRIQKDRRRKVVWRFVVRRSSFVVRRSSFVVRCRCCCRCRSLSLSLSFVVVVVRRRRFLWLPLVAAAVHCYCCCRCRRRRRCRRRPLSFVRRRRSFVMACFMLHLSIALSFCDRRCWLLRRRHWRGCCGCFGPWLTLVVVAFVGCCIDSCTALSLSSFVVVCVVGVFRCPVGEVIVCCRVIKMATSFMADERTVIVAIQLELSRVWKERLRSTFSNIAWSLLLDDRSRRTPAANASGRQLQECAARRAVLRTLPSAGSSARLPVL